MDGAVNHKEESFFLNNFNIDKVFNTIERADYLFLYYIKYCGDQTQNKGRVYLSALSETMNIGIPELSKAMESLQNKGYILWQTDDEAGRTYVELTSKAVELMNDERKRMENCYRRIQDEIGMEELERTLQTMKKITSILNN